MELFDFLEHLISIVPDVLRLGFEPYLPFMLITYGLAALSLVVIAACFLGWIIYRIKKPVEHHPITLLLVVIFLLLSSFSISQAQNIRPLLNGRVGTLHNSPNGETQLIFNFPGDLKVTAVIPEDKMLYGLRKYREGLEGRELKIGFHEELDVCEDGTIGTISVYTLTSKDPVVWAMVNTNPDDIIARYREEL